MNEVVVWLAYRKHDKNMNLRAKYAEVVVVVVVVVEV